MRNFTRSIRGELEVLNGVMVTVVHPVASSYGNYALFAYASVDASPTSKCLRFTAEETGNRVMMIRIT